MVRSLCTPLSNSTAQQSSFIRTLQSERKHFLFEFKAEPVQAIIVRHQIGNSNFVITNDE